MRTLGFARLIRLVAIALALAAPSARALDLIEYYHAGLDHYFITGNANEIRVLDSGVQTGWSRTAHTLQVFDAGDARLANSIAVCRFYGNPAFGLDSHFYSATPQECEDVKRRFPDAWLLESDDVFRMHALTLAGQCPAGTKAVYRLYNGRADVNHRYTSDPDVADAMIARGYVIEGTGSGSRPVVFCSADIARAQPAAGAPACTLSASTLFPALGAPLQMTATCTGAPTTYAWINCASYTPTCTATASTAGTVVYGIVATNASGPGAPTTLTMNWQSAASAAPTCTVVASTPTPRFGDPLTLTGACDGPVAKYDWLSCSAPGTCTALAECASSTTVCAPTPRQLGPASYALRATNNAGTGPTATVSVTWGAAPPSVPPTGTPPTCTLVASSTAPAINSTLTLTATCTNGATTYQWTNCTSTSATCTTTSASAGQRVYYVNGRNAAGTGPAASVVVNWFQPATTVPSCTLSANSTEPFAGSTVTLVATCTQSPTAYNWVGCTSNGNTCQATRAQEGQATYSVSAVNGFGAGAPASITLNWQTPPPAGPDFCGSYTKVLRLDLVWGGFRSTNDPGGGLEANGVFAGRLQVPANATAAFISGLLSVVEFVDGSAERIVTLSPAACDFRGYQPGVFPTPDPTGVNGPLAWAYGINPNVLFGLAGMPGNSPKLVPGQTYYVNVRNVVQSTGGPSCPSAECNVRVTINPPQ